MVAVSLLLIPGLAQADSPRDRFIIKSQAQAQLDTVLRPLRHAQSDRAKENEKFRSRSEVMKEVKRRYDARVLKISLNRQKAVYNVRMLMPNGKVRSIQVSARR